MKLEVTQRSLRLYFDSLRRNILDRGCLANRILRMASIRSQLLSLGDKDFEVAITSIQGMLAGLVDKAKKEKEKKERDKRRQVSEQRLVYESTMPSGPSEVTRTPSV